MKISVAMCTYNGEKYIKNQITSILTQSVAVDEIIICDDNSNDNTLSILMQFQIENVHKIKIYQNEFNIGSNKNFEKAIEISSGDYIFLSDQDDIWKVNKVEKVIQHFTENPSIEAIFSNADLINEKNEKIGAITLWDSVFFIEKQLKKPLDLFCLIKSKRNMVTGATLCIKKEVKNLILPFPNIKKYYHDEWIAIIIASRNKLNYITEELISYRIHSNQQIGGNTSFHKNTAKKHLRICNYILGNSIPKTYQDYNQVTKTYYRHYLKYLNVFENTKDNLPVNFKEIAEANLEFYKKFNISLNEKFPILYFLRNGIDKLRGKRQFK